LFESRGDGVTFGLGIIAGFGLGGRDISDRLEEASVVEPVDPFEGGVFDGLEAAPRPAPMDDLGLVEAVDGLGEGVVVRVADAADRRNEARLDQSLGVLDRDVLRAADALLFVKQRFGWR
jgi:hypothetical protein